MIIIIVPSLVYPHLLEIGDGVYVINTPTHNSKIHIYIYIWIAEIN